MVRSRADQKRAAPRVIELVGPPGSGKSTIARMLGQAHPEIQLETFPYFRNAKHVPFFAWNSMRLGPELLLLLARGETQSFPTKRDIAFMSILTGWNETLLRQSSRNRQLVVLDEGPICLMAKLRAYGSESVRSMAAQGWWARIYRRWRTTLDMVIVFQAPVAVLLGRVRARGVQYEMQDMSDEEACRHLRHIQTCEESVVRELTSAPHSPPVWHVSTQDICPDEVAQETLAVLRRWKAVQPIEAETR